MFFALYKTKAYKYIAAPVFFVACSSIPAFAEGPRQPSSMSNSFAVLMLIIIAALALIIFMMSKLVIGAASIFLEKQKQEEKAKSAVPPPSAIFIFIFVLSSVHLFAQEKPAVAGVATDATNYQGISPTAYYLVISVVSIELILIAVLLYMIKVFAGIQKKEKAVTAVVGVVKPNISWWDRFNKFKPIAQEVNIDLGHDYDGIRELDNRLPPWWLYGFYCTIVFAGVYLYMHEVSHSAPSGIEEYQIAVTKATIEKEEFLKKSANNVDETTVKLLTDDASVAAGKQIFQSTCFACHGKQGEGGVGPNLTDDYWLHGGTINDVFKTIKYGWADKGMKSWNDDFSPIQIAQIASYVKSLHGTKPANAKPAQGVLFTESVNNTQPIKKDTTAGKKNS